MRHLRLLRYARPYWRSVAGLLGLMGLSVLLGLLQPWPMKLLVDNVLGDHRVPATIQSALEALPGPGGKEELLLWIAVATVGLFVIGTAISMTNQFVDVRFSHKMAFQLAADLFLHMQKLSLIFHSRRAVGDSMSRITGDTYCVELLLTSVLLPLLQAVVTLVAMFVIMWQLQSTMTLLALAIVPFLAVLIRVYGRPLKTNTTHRREAEGRMYNVLQQALTAIPAVQAFSREQLEYERFRGYAEDTVGAYVRSTRTGMWFRFFVGLVSAVGTAGIIYMGGRLALEGKLTIGTILVFVAYLAQLYGPLNAIVYSLPTYQQAAAQADRVLEILDTEAEVQDAEDARELELHGHVRFEHVWFGYDQGRAVLKDVSLEVEPGEVLAIVGPTGAGKTTLVNLVVRFFDPWEGRVTMDGHDLREFKVRSLREQVAIVLQEPFIFPFTIAENIAYGRPDASREEVVAAAVAANADPFIERLPEGYDTIVGERGATLSGGEKQRLSIARAFLKDAPILILDEPTSALDARTEALLLDALERLMEGRVTFIIAHRLSTIRKADRILVVDNGQIIEQGGHAELIANDGLYASLYRQQMEIARHAGPEVAAADVSVNGTRNGRAAALLRSLLAWRPRIGEPSE